MVKVLISKKILLVFDRTNFPVTVETLLFHLLSIVDASVVEVEDKGKEKNANKTQPSSQ